MSLKGDQATSRAMNKRVLLGLLLRMGPLSRRDLARSSRLSPGAVTALVQDLMSEGLVAEMDAGESSGGRRPIPLQICFGARFSIGIKLSEAGLSGVLTDLAATEIMAAHRPAQGLRPEEVVDQLAEIVAELAPEHDPRRQKLIGVGIALPGFVDVDRGTVSSVSRILSSDMPIARIVSQRIGLPVWIDNDVNAYVIAHRRFGLARGKETVLAIVLGTGVGAGLVIAGKIHRGAHFRAGEIGFSPSMALRQPGQTMGQSFSTAAIEAEWQALNPRFPDIPAAVAAGDPATLCFLDGKGQEIGRRIAVIVQMIDPDTIVIGGETLNYGPDFTQAIQAELERNLLSPHGEIVFDAQNDLWGRGAAALAIDHFFDFENAAGHVATSDAD